MKYNHVTINSNQCTQLETRDQYKNIKNAKMNEELFDKIMSGTGKPVEVLDGVYAKGVLETDAYSISLMTEGGLPLLETSGVISEDRKEEIVTFLKDLEKMLYGKTGERLKLAFGTKTKELEYDVPVVYDFIFPTVAVMPYITRWTGGFCSAMGAIAFERMRRHED